MKINVYKHVLKASKAAYPSSKCLHKRLKFLLDAFFNQGVLKSFIRDIYACGYSNLFYHDFPILIVVNCPYIHNKWSVHDRFKVILQHYKIIKKMPDVLNLVDQKPRLILDLSNYLVDTFITLDKANWFVREGEIVLNLFKEDQRLMSLVFTFSKLDNELVIYIGALQGLQSNHESLEVLKQVTKSLEGLRPADLLLEVLRIIALNVGVQKVLAISDGSRHHRHKYFGIIQLNFLKTNYDKRWIENQGVLLDNGFFSLPIKKHRKDIAEVASNKRGLYRRRYEMLDFIEAKLNELLSKDESDLESLDSKFLILIQQKVIDLNPEKTVLAKAMFESADYQIKFGNFSEAKISLESLIKQYPDLEITLTAKKRLSKLEIVNAIEGTTKTKKNGIVRKNRLKPDQQK